MLWNKLPTEVQNIIDDDLYKKVVSNLLMQDKLTCELWYGEFEWVSN